MKLTMNGEDRSESTVESAAQALVRIQPKQAQVNGIVIDRPERWTVEAASEEVAVALSAGDWYWLDGSAYCPACVECDSPAIDAGDPRVQRGGAVSVCSCCKTDYAA
jgi:hypothetical protein